MYDIIRYLSDEDARLSALLEQMPPVEYVVLHRPFKLTDIFKDKTPREIYQRSLSYLREIRSNSDRHDIYATKTIKQALEFLDAMQQVNPEMVERAVETMRGGGA